MIRIRSKRHLFRRCGIAHPKVAVAYPDGRFSAAELAILKAEPMLVVEEIRDVDENTAAVSHTAPEGPLPDSGVIPAAKKLVVAVEDPAESGKEPAKTGKKGKR